MFSVENHCWPWEPNIAGSQILCGRTLMAGETLDGLWGAEMVMTRLGGLLREYGRAAA